MKFEAFSHGRVNLIGEHTDYNGGWVLPTTIPQKTTIRLERKPDRTVKVETDGDVTGHGEPAAVYELGSEKPTGTWIDYLQGATHLLAKAGHRIGGFEARISSTVPLGSGLSSSAALEVSFLKALRSAYDLKISDVEIAQLGQRIENEFVGARVGIMDQMACALARGGEALFLDTYELTYERVSLPLEDCELVVINSGISHRLSAGDTGYNKRREQCEEACRILEIKHLRGMKDVKELDRLPELLLKRARHVVTENARVHEAVAALRGRDLKTLGKLFFESHKSMRDDYEVSIPEIDSLVKFASEQPDVFGARLTGGGFGGSIVVLTKPRRGQEVGQSILQAYHEKYPNVKATVLV